MFCCTFSKLSTRQIHVNYSSVGSVHQYYQCTWWQNWFGSEYRIIAQVVLLLIAYNTHICGVCGAYCAWRMRLSESIWLSVYTYIRWCKWQNWSKLDVCCNYIHILVHFAIQNSGVYARLLAFICVFSHKYMNNACLYTEQVCYGTSQDMKYICCSVLQCTILIIKKILSGKDYSNIWTCHRPSTKTQRRPVLMTINHYRYMYIYQNTTQYVY